MPCCWEEMTGMTPAWESGWITTPSVTRPRQVLQSNYCILFIIKTMTLEWTLGDVNHYAGWHCSWCYPPPGIKIKLESAQRHDKPRWGDFPDKLNLDYIASLIRNGEWFDGKHPLIPVNRRKTSASIYAPPFFLDNEDRFEYLLVPPDDRVWQSDTLLMSETG